MSEQKHVPLLTDLLSDQQIAEILMQLQRKEQECEASGGHQRVATKDTRWGWHEGHCSKCGKDLSYDSGD